jgi:hypothetical protein
VNYLYGLKVVNDYSMVDKVWVFPQDRFVEYEPKDEWWCRKYGFGHEETRPKAEVVRVGDTLYGHPTTLERVSVAMKKLNEVFERRTRELYELPQDGPKQAFAGGYGTTSHPERLCFDVSATSSSFPLPAIGKLDWNFPAPSGERMTFTPHRNLTREAFMPCWPSLLTPTL